MSDDFKRRQLRTVKSMPTIMAKRDSAIDAMHSQARSLMMRASQGGIGRLDGRLHCLREERAAASLQATAMRMQAMGELAKAATEATEHLIEYRDARVRAEAQTLAMPYALKNYVEAVVVQCHIAALDRDAMLSRARVENYSATAEKVVAEAKLSALVDDIKAARSNRLMNGIGVRVDREKDPHEV